MRNLRNPFLCLSSLGVLAWPAAGCGQQRAPRTEDIRAALAVLAADSLEGRRTGSPGSAAAAAYIAGQLAAFGVEPAGDDGYFQPVPMVRVERGGREGAQLVSSLEELEGVPAERRMDDVNVIGRIPGSDPALREEVVVIGAHFDHVGIGRPVDGDSIYNGADDDASGVVAVLEIARSLAAGPAPGRTVVFALFTGEEMGMLGTRWYLDHPAIPLEQTVANLQIEMIGRPDDLAGGAGRAWLTGYELSTMGDMLRDAGIAIIADPRPDQNFFRRSDNYPFALRGIPAHTLSSFNGHSDYHRPSDEVSQVDLTHMTAVITAAVEAARLLANGPRPQWHPGGRPEPR